MANKLAGLLGIEAEKQTIQLVQKSFDKGVIGGYNAITGEVLTLAVKNIDNANDNDAAVFDEKEMTVVVDTDRLFKSNGLDMIRVADKQSNDAITKAVEAFKTK